MPLENTPRHLPSQCSLCVEVSIDLIILEEIANQPSYFDRCQRQFKTDPLIGNIANLKLTHPGRLSIG
jgi:hypothetical protein